MRKLFFSFLIFVNFFYIRTTKEFLNEILSYIEYNSRENLNISQEEKTFHYKSIDNVDYNITIAISSFKLQIKIDEFDISLISYKNEYSFADLFFLNNYFRIFNSINEIYEDLIEHFENEIEIIKVGENVNLIVPIQNSFINNITFSNIRKYSNNAKEKIRELYNLINELKKESDKCKIKIDELLNENLELKKEINDFKKGNVLLISDGSSLFLRNILQISPYYNKISILSPNYIIPRLKEDIMSNFKIIIYDLKDSGYGNADDTNELKKYLNNGGTIVVTHDQWFCHNYKGHSYELFNATIISSINMKVVNKANILNSEHPIFSSFYQLNDYNLEISNTHLGYNKYLDNDYFKDMVIELDDGVHTEYLLIKNYGKGKLIFWNVGHESSLTDYEEKLFINIISWIYKNE